MLGKDIVGLESRTAEVQSILLSTHNTLQPCQHASASQLYILPKYSWQIELACHTSTSKVGTHAMCKADATPAENSA